MFRKLILPLIAVIGIIFSIFMIFRGLQRPPEQPILFPPPSSPYKHYVAGEGIIESHNKNVELGVAYPDLIWNRYVEVGQKVAKGTPLFKTDTRQQEADLKIAQEERAAAATILIDRTKQFSYYERLEDKSAVSEKAYSDAYYAKQEAEDRYRVAVANVQKLETVIERAMVRAPFDGEIIQENARVGEFANVNPFDQIPLMIFGDTQTYDLRISIAEEDAWRVIENAPGEAYVRGNSSIKIPITFSYIEPLLVPKQSLTGSDFERVDTRVLQVIYNFERKKYPIFIGQLLDVYLEARPNQYEA